jgi:hypothetical protein
MKMHQMVPVVLKKQDEEAQSRHNFSDKQNCPKRKQCYFDENIQEKIRNTVDILPRSPCGLLIHWCNNFGPLWWDPVEWVYGSRCDHQKKWFLFQKTNKAQMALKWLGDRQGYIGWPS